MLPTSFHFSISEVAPYINWLYFFHAWNLPARMASLSTIHQCPACRQQWLNEQERLANENAGGALSEEQIINVRARAREAMKLFDDATALLRQSESRFRTHARFALFECNSLGDDILVDTGKVVALPFLRQQVPSPDGLCYCLSDFVRPLGKGRDHIGLFACTVDEGMERNGAGEDEYLHLLSQTLADRLAEATAERLHELVRKEIWGYAPDENLTPQELFQEKYQGRRPAVGYPSAPDQSLAFLLDEILQFQEIGICLTENGAMLPHASTCGLMISHPLARHFSVGPVSDDQLLDYARRRQLPLDHLRRFLTR